MDSVPAGAIAALIGLIGGVVLGLAARLGDMVGLIDLSKSCYHAIVWNPAASVVGGLMFGYGMALAGNCGFGALVRFGGGDLRSRVGVVVMGIFGFVALSGPLAPLRTALFPQPDATGPQGILHDLSVWGIPSVVTIGGLAALLIFWALSHAGLRSKPCMMAWGVAAGLAVAWCFAGTTWLSEASMGAVAIEGPSFTAPVGRTLIFLMTSTDGGITFSVGAVVGVMAGELIGSMVRGMFR